jgi:hypothetical protein
MGIINILQKSALLTACYVGWNHGAYLKKTLNHQYIKPYKDKIIPFNDNDIINENVFCSISCSLFALYVANNFWYATLPYSIWWISRKYPKETKSAYVIANKKYNEFNIWFNKKIN